MHMQAYACICIHMHANACAWALCVHVNKAFCVEQIFFKVPRCVLDYMGGKPERGRLCQA